MTNEAASELSHITASATSSDAPGCSTSFGASRRAIPVVFLAGTAGIDVDEASIL